MRKGSCRPRYVQGRLTDPSGPSNARQFLPGRVEHHPPIRQKWFLNSMTTTQTRFSRLSFDLQPPIARICLNNPPLNIIDIPMMEELAEALIEIESRSDIAAVILGGSQKAFSVGVDVGAHTPDKVEPMLAKFHAVIR